MSFGVRGLGCSEESDKEPLRKACRGRLRPLGYFPQVICYYFASRRNEMKMRRTLLRRLLCPVSERVGLPRSSRITGRDIPPSVLRVRGRGLGTLSSPSPASPVYAEGGWTRLGDLSGRAGGPSTCAYRRNEIENASGSVIDTCGFHIEKTNFKRPAAFRRRAWASIDRRYLYKQLAAGDVTT